MRTFSPADQSSALPLRVLLVASNDTPTALAAVAAGRRPVVRLEPTRPEAFAEPAFQTTADVVVVDGRMPRALRAVRAAFTALPEVPILFLAASLDDVAAAANAGASDFAMSDASAAEVTLRLRLLANGSVRATPTSREFGTLRLDRESRRLSHAGNVVSLSPIELKLLERLLLQPGKPVSRAELQRSIWAQVEVDEQPTNIAVVYVSYVRAKLAKLGGGCSIRTITNVGYVLDLHPAAPSPRRARRGTRR
ncbi:MAG: response regulator transcription factor [Gemmatimonadetes bacterium]|nr:response regulator transcription factor [Gemmatimonadota bacterium]